MAEEGDNEDKTEEPSQKRLDEALERGDVVKSQEVSTFFGLGAITVMVAWMSTGISRDLMAPLAAMLDHAHEISFDQAGLSGVFARTAYVMGSVLLLPMLLFMVAGIAGNMIQHRIVFSLEPLMPKLSKVSPMAGLQRLFSMESVVTFIKGLVKIFIVGAAMWMAIKPELVRLDSIVASEPIGLLKITQALGVKLMTAVMVVMAFVAALDYLYQRHHWMQKLRMTKQEMKDEYKQQEGNPEIKQKIRQLQRQRSRRRMMAAVPDATVIVANPTHYAVALRYEAGMSAPRCVAKGIDTMALKIREVAEAADVPVVENPPLARLLHASVEIDEDVPEEHYRAVAELIGYVMKLKAKRPQ